VLSTAVKSLRKNNDDGPVYGPSVERSKGKRRTTQGKGWEGTKKTLFTLGGY